LFPNSTLVFAEITVADFLRKDWVVGFDLAIGGGQSAVLVETGALPFDMRQLTLGASIGVEHPILSGRFVPFWGIRLAFMWLSRTFEDDVISAQYFSTFSPGLVPGLAYRVSRHVSVGARVRSHYLHYNVDENRSLGFLEVASALRYDF
jgi:hypothetical protein